MISPSLQNVVAVHGPYGQDPGIGGDLAYDAGDERAVPQGPVELADQRVVRVRPVPGVLDHLARLVTARPGVLPLLADGILDLVIDRDEAAGGRAVTAPGHRRVAFQPRMGSDARIQDGDHRAPAVVTLAVPGRPARWRVEEKRDRGSRIAAAELVGVGDGGPAPVAAVVRASRQAAGTFTGRGAHDGRADQQVLERELPNPLDQRLEQLLVQVLPPARTRRRT